MASSFSAYLEICIESVKNDYLVFLPGPGGLSNPGLISGGPLGSGGGGPLKPGGPLTPGGWNDQMELYEHTSTSYPMNILIIPYISWNKTWKWAYTKAAQFAGVLC